MKPLPHTAEELIAELELAYPPACIGPQDSLNDHLRYAGRVDLIQDLRRRFQWSQEEATAAQLMAKL